jgi:hypothetical protein
MARSPIPGDSRLQLIDHVLPQCRIDLTVVHRPADQRQIHALATLETVPVEVVTDAAPAYPAVLAGLVPAAWHHVERYANNPVEADHGRNTARTAR